jgi:hypothetical protein
MPHYFSQGVMFHPFSFGHSHFCSCPAKKVKVKMGEVVIDCYRYILIRISSFPTNRLCSIHFHSVNPVFVSVRLKM